MDFAIFDKITDKPFDWENLKICNQIIPPAGNLGGLYLGDLASTMKD